MCLAQYFVRPITGFGGFQFLVWSDVLIMAESWNQGRSGASCIYISLADRRKPCINTEDVLGNYLVPTGWLRHLGILGSLAHLWSQLLLSWTLCCPQVLLARDSLVQLGESLCLGEAVLLISILSGSSWQTATSIFCKTVKDCNPCNQR